jgi:hypothetical protein
VGSLFVHLVRLELRNQPPRKATPHHPHTTWATGISITTSLTLLYIAESMVPVDIPRSIPESTR